MMVTFDVTYGADQLEFGTMPASAIRVRNVPAERNGWEKPLIVTGFGEECCVASAENLDAL